MLQYKPEKGRDVLGFIKVVTQRPMKVEEAKMAKEVFMVGSNTLVCGATPSTLLFASRHSLVLECELCFLQVMPVIKWDDTEILQTKPYAEVGVMALSLRALLEEDMDPTANRCDVLKVSCRCWRRYIWRF